MMTKDNIALPTFAKFSRLLCCVCSFFFTHKAKVDISVVRPLLWFRPESEVHRPSPSQHRPEEPCMQSKVAMDKKINFCGNEDRLRLNWPNIENKIISLNLDENVHIWGRLTCYHQWSKAQGIRQMQKCSCSIPTETAWRKCPGGSMSHTWWRLRWRWGENEDEDQWNTELNMPSPERIVLASLMHTMLGGRRLWNQHHHHQSQPRWSSSSASAYFAS